MSQTGDVCMQNVSLGRFDSEVLAAQEYDRGVMLLAKDGRATNFPVGHRHFIGSTARRGGPGRGHAGFLRGSRGRGRAGARGTRGLESPRKLLVPRGSDPGPGGGREPYSLGVFQITPGNSREATPAQGGKGRCWSAAAFN